MINAEQASIGTDHACRSALSAVKISCIIPSLNRGAILCNAVRMLLEQSHPLHEIIVVDQSPQPEENIRTTLSTWEQEGRIRWLRQKEPNASKARNRGALAASGDILLFLDDDIQVESGFVEAHARNYLDSNVVAVAGQVLEGNREVTTELLAPPDDPAVGWIRFPKNYAKSCKTSWMAAGNFSVRRAAYFQVGGMDENYRKGSFREESDFAMRFLESGYQFQFEPAASITHLGVRVIPYGGARTWTNPLQWHHCVGDWYFNLKHAHGKAAFPLYWYSFRHLVASSRKVRRPWLMLISGICWLLSLPIALFLRLRGAQLVTKLPPSNSLNSE